MQVSDLNKTSTYHVHFYGYLIQSDVNLREECLISCLKNWINDDNNKGAIFEWDVNLICLFTRNFLAFICWNAGVFYYWSMFSNVWFKRFRFSRQKYIKSITVLSKVEMYLSTKENVDISIKMIFSSLIFVNESVLISY